MKLALEPWRSSVTPLFLDFEDSLRVLALLEDAPIADVDVNVSLSCEVTQDVLL